MSKKEKVITIRVSDSEYHRLSVASGGNMSNFLREKGLIHAGGDQAMDAIRKKISYLNSVIHQREIELAEVRREKSELEEQLNIVHENRQKYLEYRQELLEAYMAYRQGARNITKVNKLAWLEGRGSLILDCDFESIEEALEWCDRNATI